MIKHQSTAPTYLAAKGLEGRNNPEENLWAHFREDELTVEVVLITVASVRLRKVTAGPGSRAARLAMASI